MNQELVFKELAELLKVDPDLVNPEFRLSDGEWDSVAVMSAIALIDERFGVTVSGMALTKCITVADVLNLAKVTEGRSE